MGRKPKSFVATFFDRGAKLPDSSNRYEQICKWCSEKFEKGRFETIANHILLERCLAIPHDERLRFARLYDEDRANAQSNSLHYFGHVEFSALEAMSPAELIGLQALAEVSSGHHHGSGSAHQVSGTSGSSFNNRASYSPAQGQKDSSADQEPKATAVLRVAEAALQLQPRSADVPSLTQENVTMNDSGNDTVIPSQRSSVQPGAFPQSSANPRRRLQKIRGSFDQETREKVHAVRKIGACLRCRLLKKTCDQKNPCTKCEAIGHARLYAMGCTRMRLSDLLRVFNTGYCTLITGHLKEHLVKYANPSRLPGRVEVEDILDPRLITTGTCYAYPEGYSVYGIIIEGDMIFQKKLSIFLESTLSAYVKTSPSGQCRIGQASVKTALGLKDHSSKAGTLIAQVLHLYAATRLLTSSNLHASWCQIRPTEPGEEVTGTEAVQELDMAFISWQIRKELERIASGIAGKSMSQIEGFMINRQKIDRFELFLICTLFVLSVERLAHFFRTIDKETKDETPPTVDLTEESHSSNRLDDNPDCVQEVVQISGHASNGSASGRESSSWTPLNQMPASLQGSLESSSPEYLFSESGADQPWPGIKESPQLLWQQSERFSNTIAELVSMRKITPQLYLDQSKTLLADPAESEECHAWFRDLNIRDRDLDRLARSSTEVDGKNQWEGRYFVKLLHFAPLAPT